MRALALSLALLGCFGIAVAGAAGDAYFTGTWSIDVRSAEQRSQGVECGTASFSLHQVQNRIFGNHVFFTPGCGRINEGGQGTVKGIVIGTTAVLVVTSGRNGAIVMGVARRKGSSLQWKTLEEIRPGEPEGDSPLILQEGLLSGGKADAK